MFSDDELKDLVKDLRSRGLDDEFIKQKLKERDVKENKIDEVLNSYSTKKEEVLDKSLFFIFNNFTWILAVLAIVFLGYFSIFDKLAFVILFPIIVLIILIGLVMGAAISLGINHISSVTSIKKSKTGFKKNFFFGLLVAFFINLVGLPQSIFLVIYLFVIAIPLHFIFMFFYDLILSESLPIIILLLIVMFILSFLIPFIYSALLESAIFITGYELPRPDFN